MCTDNRMARAIAKIMKIKCGWAARAAQHYHSPVEGLQGLKFGRDDRRGSRNFEDDIGHPAPRGVSDLLADGAISRIEWDYSLIPRETGLSGPREDPHQSQGVRQQGGKSARPVGQGSPARRPQLPLPIEASRDARRSSRFGPK